MVPSARPRHLRCVAAFVGVVSLASWVGTTVSAAPLTPPEPSPAGARQQEYAAAATEFGVPEAVLLGVSYLESRWDFNAGTPSTSGGYGPMHLTDAAHVASLPTGTGHHHDGIDDDPRGDEARPSVALPFTESPVPDAAALQTLDTAAALVGTSADRLRSDPAANIRAGAALLAEYQRDLGAPTGTGSDPADWYGAVARYSGAGTANAAEEFANEVYATMREGVQRVTDDGQRVTLVGDADLVADASWLDQLGLPRTDDPDGVECPRQLSCEWLPAPYELRGDGTNLSSYGNHDLGNRPEQQEIEYIVIHDTEEFYDRTVELAQDKNWVSWHYSLRSTDGHIAQHVRSNDVAWHAGNWFINAKAIGLEHEGFAAQGTWYTEAMYRTSATLVGYLADRFDIPLDREHIIGHDNVPGTVPSTVATMHWDPGPYWDWAHYFDLLGAPFESTGSARTGLVTIDPDFTANQPAFSGCRVVGEPCPARGSSSVILHTEPNHDAPLVTDPGLHPDGSPSTMHISDHGARVSAGQTYAVADQAGDWTAIWCLGQKAWFHNPRTTPAAEWARGRVVVPRPGKASVPVYGRAYPEPEAFAAGIPVQEIVPLPYTFTAGQRYAAGPRVDSEYYRASTFDGSSPGDWTVVRGDKEYVQIQFGHRIAFVDADDVFVIPSAVGARQGH